MQVPEIVARLDRRYRTLQSQRSNWESHWQELADYMLPRKADITKKRTEGDKRTELIYDGTAIHAVELLASSLHGMLTSPSTPWFSLQYRNRELQRDVTRPRHYPIEIGNPQLVAVRRQLSRHALIKPQGRPKIALAAMLPGKSLGEGIARFTGNPGDQARTLCGVDRIGSQSAVAPVDDAKRIRLGPHGHAVEESGEGVPVD